jgi:ribose 1,5-bisphosphokinase PhnN
VLAASGPACRDLVLGILRRRLAGNPRITFPMLAVEAALNAGGVEASLVLTRRQFRAFEADGAFALVWRDHGVRTGLPNTFLDPLARGQTLVVPGPATLAIDARGLVGRVAVLAVGGELDRARQQLTPQACLKRLASPAVRQRLGRLKAAEPTVAVAVSGSLGRSLDELTAAIEALAT